MNKAEPIIKLQNIWKVYQLADRELPILKNVSVELPTGSFSVILGPSGSGKSTLLNVIGCLDVPTKGKIFLEGKDLSLVSESELATIRGKKIGFIFQQFNLLRNLSALENVMLPMVFQGIAEKERREKAGNLLFDLGLGNRVHHRPTELSGGEQQRVAIARALGNDPEIIVADEPTGNLDSITGKKIMDILVDLNEKQNKTIIMVTHDSYIASFSKSTIRIKDGEIVS